MVIEWITLIFTDRWNAKFCANIAVQLMCNKYSKINYKLQRIAKFIS